MEDIPSRASCANLQRVKQAESRRDVQIWTPDQRLRVFISSTIVELAEERRAALRAISTLRLTPVLFELGARPHAPRELYRAYLAQSDVFIGLYWQQYGQIVTGMKVSGLEEEFKLSRDLPRLMYVKTPAPNRDPRLEELLSRLKAETSYRRFATAAELDRLVRDDLATLLSERFARPRGATPNAALRGRRPLPVSATSLVGRKDAIAELAGLVGQPDARLVTLTGPGGVGKTRLAIAVGERLLKRFGPCVAFVPLDTATRGEQALAAVGQAVRAELGGASVFESLVERLGDTPWLLILDNLEQVVDVARDLDALLTRCPSVAILATSRMALRLRAEREYPVPPLELPDISTSAKLDELEASPAVALFVDRAVTVRHDFALTKKNAESVLAICRRLDGLPLAIELAAARTRLLEPDAILRRLETSLDTLGTGTVDMPARQHTLRATVEWSVGMLDETERSMLETMAVFVGGWTIEAAALVAGLDENESLELNEALARHSLVHIDNTPLGPRARLLDTIREFVAERLARREDFADIERRHADCYRVLAEQSDERLRGAVGHQSLHECLHAEFRNLAAAVEWYLVHDRKPLPHLFRVLWPFWEIQDYMRRAQGWVQRLMSAGDDFDLQGRAEMLWAAVVTANELGDDAAVLTAREQLSQILDHIRDPGLHAVSLLAMAWTSPIVGDVERALREASGSLNELRNLDEPYWLGVALVTSGFLETAVGHHIVALTHFREARGLAERFDNTWLAAISELWQGILALRGNRPDDARASFDEALDLAVSTHSTRAVALCLIGCARFAVTTGDAQKAALLKGAAQGLRKRICLRVWPPLRRDEQEFDAELRQALGTEQFDKLCAEGARLNEREAVAVARSQRIDRIHSAGA